MRSALTFSEHQVEAAAEAAGAGAWLGSVSSRDTLDAPRWGQCSK